MTAAILQGVPATTLDTDIWLELPERQYVKALDIAKKLGAEILARTVVALEDDTLVNFLIASTASKPLPVSMTKPRCWSGTAGKFVSSR